MESEKVIQIIRRLRHDYGNHLQVIMSNNDLGRTEAIRDYILQIAEEIRNQRVLFEKLDADAALYMMEQEQLARDMGIIFRYGAFNITSFGLLRGSREPLKTLQQLLDQLPPLSGLDREPVFSLSFYQEADTIRMIMTCEEMDMVKEVLIKE